MVPSEGQRNVRMKTRRRVAGLHPTAMTLTCLHGFFSTWRTKQE